MNCPFCAAENGTTANYCSSCGSPLHLRVCPHCEGVNEKTATACISCGGALVAEPERLAGPAMATRIAARQGVMDDNVIDLEPTGLTWANNDWWENNWPQGRRERAWPEDRPENIGQQNNRKARSADVERLLRDIDEEIHRLDAHARPVLAITPRAALQMPGPSEEPMAPILLHRSVAANGGVAQTQEFSRRGLVLLLVSTTIGIASYLSLPPDPLSLAGGSVADKGSGRIAAAPPASGAKTANALASPPAKFAQAIAAVPGVVPEARVNSPAPADDSQAPPQGELIAAKPQAETGPPKASTAPRPTNPSNGLETPSVSDTGNAAASQAKPSAITAPSDVPVRVGSWQSKPLSASSKTSRPNAMLGAFNEAEWEPVRRLLY